MKPVLITLLLLFLDQDVKMILGDSDALEETDSNRDTSGPKKEAGLKSFYKAGDIQCQSYIEKYNKLLLTNQNYAQRFVNLFLIITNLQDYKIKNPEEHINIDLEISITGNDLTFLQEYSAKASDYAYLRSLSKLDSILSKVARLKEKSYFEKALKASKIFFFDFNNFDIDGYHLLPFLIVLVLASIMYHFSSRKSILIYIGIIISSLIFWESLVLYKKKLKEVDIEIYVKRLKLKEIPVECDPEKISWYYEMYLSVKNLFFEDNCLQYFKNLNTVPTEEVSLLQCIIDMCGLYLVRAPLKIFGASIKDFTGEVSSYFPYPFSAIIYIPLSVFFTTCLGIFLLVIYGKQLSLSFFKSSITVRESELKSINSSILSTNRDKALMAPKENKSLKKWTKNKYLGRTDCNLGRRRKQSLKELYRNCVNNSSRNLENSEDSENT